MNSWQSIHQKHPWHRLGWRDYRHFLVVVWRFYWKWGVCGLAAAVRMAWAALWYLPTADEEAEWKIRKEPSPLTRRTSEVTNGKAVAATMERGL